MRVIGVFSPFLSGFYLGGLVAAIYERARADGNALLLVKTRTQDRSFHFPIAAEQADVWINIMDAASPDLLESIAASGRPVTTIGSDYGLSSLGAVRSCNRSGIWRAMEHLYAKGHRRFAFIGPCVIGDVEERRDAFLDFLAGHEGCFEPIVIEGRAFDFGAARATVHELLGKGMRGGALIAGTDIYALAASMVLNSTGFKVPEDFSIVGFDNSEYSRTPGKGISTLDQQLPYMVSRAYDDLLARLDEPSREPQKALCQPLFIPRHSTKDVEFEEERVMVDCDAAMAFSTVFEEIGQFYEGGREAYLQEYLKRLEQRLRYGAIVSLVENDSQTVTRHFVSLEGGPLGGDFPVVSSRDFPGAIGHKAMEPRAGDLLVLMPQGQIDYGREFLALCFDESNLRHEYLSIKMLTHELEMLNRQLWAQSLSEDLSRALIKLNTTQEALLRSEKHASLGRVIAGIAHGLNTPLGNAILMTSTLSETVVEFRQKFKGDGLRRSDIEELLTSVESFCIGVEKGVGKALKVVRDLKRVDGERFSERLGLVSLPIFLRDLVAMLRVNAAETEVEIEYVMDMDVSIETHPQLLSQVIVELVENALKHGFMGRKGRIEIRALPHGERLQIRVSDDGVGMSRDEMRKVFDPFYTTHMSTATGLGLTMVSNIVTGPLSGWVWAEPSEPGGACFVVELPRNLSIAALS